MKLVSDNMNEMVYRTVLGILIVCFVYILIDIAIIELGWKQIQSMGHGFITVGLYFILGVVAALCFLFCLVLSYEYQEDLPKGFYCSRAMLCTIGIPPTILVLIFVS